MTTLTPKKIAELLDVCAVATPGPLEIVFDSRPDIATAMVYTRNREGGYGEAGQLVRRNHAGLSKSSGRLHIIEYAKYCDNLNDCEFYVAAADPDTGYAAALRLIQEMAVSVGKLLEAQAILRDVWMQFSMETTVDGQPKRTDGGLSTLVDVAEFLGIDQ